MEFVFILLSVFFLIIFWRGRRKDIKGFIILNVIFYNVDESGVRSSIDE